MSEDGAHGRNAPADPFPAYEAPAILWEEEMPQGPNILAACGKVGPEGGLCTPAPGS